MYCKPAAMKLFPLLFALFLAERTAAAETKSSNGTTNRSNDNSSNRSNRKLSTISNGNPKAQIHPEQVMPAQRVHTKFLPPVDMEKVQEEDEVSRLKGEAPRFAVVEHIDVNMGDGDWEQVEDGTVWRHTFEAPSASCKSLHFGFKGFFLPKGAKLFVYDKETGLSIGRPLTSHDNNPEKKFWTPLLKSCHVVVELDLEPGTPQEAVKDFTVADAFIGYKEFGRKGDDVVDDNDGRRGLAAGGCNVDVKCSEGNGWEKEINSVVMLARNGDEGSRFCSGAMLNNARNDRTPFMLTAYHCGVRSGNADTLTVFFNYERSECGTGSAPLGQWISGATVRAESGVSDATLVEFRQPPSNSWNVAYAGWDRTGDPATGVTGIHHPDTDVKKISFDSALTSFDSFDGSGSDTHIRVPDWDFGTTEPGSSGSPLFDRNHRIIGQLHGGGAACAANGLNNNGQPDWYGRLFVSWNVDPNFGRFLDPDNTGLQVLDTLAAHEPQPGCSSNGVCGDGCLNRGEVCDGEFFGDTTCFDFGHVGGSLSCDGCARIDTTGCYKELQPVQINLSDNQDGTTHRGSFTVPSDATHAQIEIYGFTGDPDLHVLRGTGVGTGSGEYDCRPYSGAGENEVCTFSQPGVYSYLIHAYDDYDRLTVAVISDGSGGPPPPVTRSPTVSPTPEPTPVPTETPTKEPTPFPTSAPSLRGGSCPASQRCGFSCQSQGFLEDRGHVACNNGCLDYTPCVKQVLDAPPFDDNTNGEILFPPIVAYDGATLMQVSMVGDNGDADLYVRRGSPPTTDDYDCRPYLNGSEEECEIADPVAGDTYHIMIRAYSSYTGVRLSVTSDGAVP